MKKIRYENGNIVNEKEYAQDLVRTFLAEHLQDSAIDEIETLEEAEKYMKKLWQEWTIDYDVEEV